MGTDSKSPNQSMIYDINDRAHLSGGFLSGLTRITTSYTYGIYYTHIPEKRNIKKKLLGVRINEGQTARRMFTRTIERTVRCRGAIRRPYLRKTNSFSKPTDLFCVGFILFFIITFTLQLKLVRGFYPQRLPRQAVITDVLPSLPRYTPSFLSCTGFIIINTS